MLEDQDVETSVLEIGYYGPRDSVEFAQVRIAATCSATAHLDVQLSAIELLLAGLREQTEQDGDRFAGYAPVLIAVADTVANENNPGALVARIERGLQPVTLQSVVTAILDREQKKLKSLMLEDAKLVDKLYARREQLDRLVARTYGTATPSPGVSMNNNDRQAYEQALETWVPEHPFLGGGGNSRSAVFDAAVSAHALRSSQSADAALRRELERGAAANPFLSVFYPRDSGTPVSEADSVELRPDHIGIVYASVRAGLALGDMANLSVAGRDDVGEDDEEALRADVEITVTRKGQEREPLEFSSEQTSAIRIGSHLACADINVPYGTVEIGSGAEAVLTAPIDIECHKLELTTDKLIVEVPSRQRDTVVFLQASAADTSITGTPVVRSNVEFFVSWPGAQAYPWTDFAIDVGQADDLEVGEGLRRLRKFVTAFRAGGKNRLARFKGKIESPRMVKGGGLAILVAMKAANIVTLEGKWYYLNTDELGKKVGVDYIGCHAYRFGEMARQFVKNALRGKAVESSGP